MSSSCKEKSIPAKQNKPFTFVTAASENHFCALESMLYAMKELRSQVPDGAFPRMVIYDLGLSDGQREVLSNLKNNDYMDEWIEFDYGAYPGFWNISNNRGEYAWKTGAVKDVQERHGGVIVWLDTGDVPNHKFIMTMPDYIRKHGFWSPRSTGLMGPRFNHPGLFKYFDIDQTDYLTKENCNGAALGFNADDPRILKEIIDPWYKCGLDLGCIAPAGSSRRNHRQDQSAISLLALRAGFRCFEYPEFHGVTIHQDDQCNERLLRLDETHKLLHPSSIDLINF
ncbi:hypothetical protein CLU79DRAFT_747776 [Phycomyces nitens]|nr:hypothetical protein CLU79DRAFT_747776 [Phycomyces nitens]